MSYWKTSLGIWGTLLLLAVALSIPRYEARMQAGTFSADASARQLAGLDYARARLWTDFLEVRRTGLAGRPLPFPTLAEYRNYLGAIGLSEPGDLLKLYVVPPLEIVPAIHSVQVALDFEQEAVALRVAMEEAGRPVPAGALVIRAVGTDSVVCDIVHSAQPQLWSFWPFTPQPLLP